jgi:hypothetical protein
MQSLGFRLGHCPAFAEHYCTPRPWQRALYIDGGGTIFIYGNNVINNNFQLGTSPTVIGLHLKS